MVPAQDRALDALGVRLPLLSRVIIAALALEVAPAPASPPIRCDPFLLFFESGSALLRPRDLPTIDRIASVSDQAKERLQVTGHADAAGPAAYNLRLSRRRAEAVKAALVARGVPASRIAVDAVGETLPLLATQGDAPAAQNRRVSVCLF